MSIILYWNSVGNWRCIARVERWAWDSVIEMVGIKIRYIVWILYTQTSYLWSDKASPVNWSVEFCPIILWHGKIVLMQYCTHIFNCELYVKFWKWIPLSFFFFQTSFIFKFLLLLMFFFKIFFFLFFSKYPNLWCNIQYIRQLVYYSIILYTFNLFLFNLILTNFNLTTCSLIT